MKSTLLSIFQLIFIQYYLNSLINKNTLFLITFLSKSIHQLFLELFYLSQLLSIAKKKNKTLSKSTYHSNQSIKILIFIKINILLYNLVTNYL